MRPLSAAARARWAVTARVVAGTLGAFAHTTLATTALSLVLAALGVTRADAVTIALMASSIVFALISLSAFHARDPFRAWMWLAGTAVPLAVLTWALLPGATP
jgi:drug/metabolite transporter (DMT)-like permease